MPFSNSCATLAFPLAFFSARMLLFLLLLLPSNAASAVYYGGIPVPGRRVPAIRSFELFLNTCRRSPTLEKLTKMLRNVDAEQIAEKLQRNLYSAVDELDTEAMMGKWHTVIYEPSVQPNQCVVSHWKPLERSANLAIFSSLQYSLRTSDGSTHISHGIGRKYGPDPWSLLISTGQQGEPCPYFPIKAGPLGKEGGGKYAYLVLTQALKQPTLVLARDPAEFGTFHRDEVRDYLTRFGYWRSPLNGGGELAEVDWAKCAREMPFYLDLEEGAGEDSLNRGGGSSLLGHFEGND